MALTEREIHQLANRYRSEVGTNSFDTEQRLLSTLPGKFETRTWEWSDLVHVVAWKTPRSKGYFERNDPDVVDGVLDDVLETPSTIGKVTLLNELSGVRTTMASAFLLFIDPEEYTVIDWRAGKSLAKHGYRSSPLPVSPTEEQYEDYLALCRKIADENGVDLRTLDRALWVDGGT